MTLPKNKKNCSSLLIFISLGSNLGDKKAAIEIALQFMSNNPGIKIISSTRPIVTSPWGKKDQPEFLNAVCQIYSQYEPLDLLRELKKIEVAMGRKKQRIKWGPRKIDLDILLYGDMTLNTSGLIIPHPYLHERDFVMKQLIELDPSLVHPVKGIAIKDLLQEYEKRKAKL